MGGSAKRTAVKTAKDIKPRSRVSTEYPKLTKKFFDDLDTCDIRYSYGATEAKVPELVDVIVDLTETGQPCGKMV